MQKVFGFMLIMAGMSAVAMATPAVPEIDPATAVSGLAVLSGAVLVIRGRRKQ